MQVGQMKSLIFWGSAPKVRTRVSVRLGLIILHTEASRAQTRPCVLSAGCPSPGRVSSPIWWPGRVPAPLCVVLLVSILRVWEGPLPTSGTRSVHLFLYRLFYKFAHSVSTDCGLHTLHQESSGLCLDSFSFAKTLHSKSSARKTVPTPNTGHIHSTKKPPDRRNWCLWILTHRSHSLANLYLIPKQPFQPPLFSDTFWLYAPPVSAKHPADVHPASLSRQKWGGTPSPNLLKCTPCTNTILTRGPLL